MTTPPPDTPAAPPPPLTLGARVAPALAIGGAIGALLCVTAWAIVFLRSLGIRVGRRRSFDQFPLTWALGTMVFCLAAFGLLAVVWPLGRSKWTAIPLATLSLFVALGLGCVSAGLLPLVPVTGDDRAYWIVLAVSSLVFGVPVGLLMTLKDPPASSKAEPVRDAASAS